MLLGYDNPQWCPQEGKRRPEGCRHHYLRQWRLSPGTPFMSHTLDQCQKPAPHRNHDNSAGRSSTQREAPPQHHQQAPVSPRPHHQGNVEPASLSRESKGAPTPYRRPLPARSHNSPAATKPRPPIATATAGHSRPATTSRNRPPTTAASTPLSPSSHDPEQTESYQPWPPPPPPTPHTHPFARLHRATCRFGRGIAGLRGDSHRRRESGPRRRASSSWSSGIRGRPERPERRGPRRHHPLGPRGIPAARSGGGREGTGKGRRC
jgi:hypothetical protein